jgi:hypothetical protein
VLATDFARFSLLRRSVPAQGARRAPLLRFHLLALDVATLALPEKAHCQMSSGRR